MSLKYTKIGETVARLNARIAELEQQLYTAEQKYTGACSKLAEAREDSKRLQKLYEIALTDATGLIVIQVPLAKMADWDGTTCLWTRELFDAAIDSARKERP